jgi:hypothetical protein
MVSSSPAATTFYHDRDGAFADERDRHQLRTPWHATQRAAWEALKKAEAN